MCNTHNKFYFNAGSCDILLFYSASFGEKQETVVRDDPNMRICQVWKVVKVNLNKYFSIY